MKLIRHLPNLLTLTNLFLGCMAIVYIYYDHLLIVDAKQNVYADMGRMEMAAFCVFAAAIIDFFDGFVARLLGVTSSIGKQLDSLADMVTFGLVPGLIMYQLIARSYYVSAEAFDYPIMYFTSGFFLTLMAAVRLARFNTEPETAGFSGLPSPSMALFVVSLPLIIFRNDAGLASMLTNKWVLLLITLLLGYLMVSRLPMPGLKLKGFAWEDNRWSYIIFLTGLIFGLGEFSCSDLPLQ